MVKSSAAIKCENFRIFNKVLHSQKRFFVSVDFVCWCETVEVCWRQLYTLQYILDPIVSKQISLFKGMFYLYLITIQTHLGPWQTGFFSIFKFGLDFAEIFKLLRNFAVCIPPIEEGFKQKPRQMSSHLFGGQILINSLPRKVCILPRSIWKKFNRFINRGKIASAARNWIKSDPKQTWRPLPWLLLVPGLFEQPVTVIMLSPRVSGASGHLGFYWIPTYCLICVYHPVRAVDQFNHWLNSTWHLLYNVHDAAYTN